VKKCLSALAAVLVTAAALAVPVPATATRYVPSAGCTTVIHRAKQLPYDEEQSAGIAASVAWGWGAELDVRLTADDQLVLVHDDTLRRISGGFDSRRPEELTLDEIRSVPLARGGQVMTLDEALTAAAGSGARLMLEIKRYSAYSARWDASGMADLAQAVRDHGLQDRVYVGGATGGIPFLRAEPDLLTYFRASPKRATDDAMMLHRGYDLVQLPVSVLDSGVISRLRAAGVVVGTRQVNRQQDVVTAFRAGLRLFQSDRGKRVRDWCQSTPIPPVIPRRG
jgi:glycerophosphoryl diester phosphodiesterase